MGQAPLVIGMESADLSAQVQRAKDTFRIQSTLVTLVRDIAVQHGGTVRIVGSSGKGTEIALTLPISGASG